MLKRCLIPIAVTGLSLTGCLDMSFETPKESYSCPDNFSKLLSSNTCPDNRTCETLPDGTLCVEIVTVNGGDGINCDSGYISVTRAEYDSKCVMEDDAELDENGELPELDDGMYYCKHGLQENRYCRKVPAETASTINIDPSQICTEDQLNPPENSLRIHVIDVGQGDALWIQSPTGQNILVDAGDGGSFNKTSAGPIVIDYLQFHGFPTGSTFDAVFLTHPHADHFGGLPTVFGNGGYNLKNYIDPIDLNRSGEFATTYRLWIAQMKNKVDPENIYMPAEDKFSAQPIMPDDFFGPNIKAEYITSDKSASDPNAASLIFRISYEGRTFLFTGDAEANQEADAIRKAPDKIASNFLKVCHHGSTTSSSPRFLDAVWPDSIPKSERAAFISSGRLPYNGTIIPNPDIVERLQAFLNEHALFATSAGDDAKKESETYRDDNILLVVKPGGSYYACYSGTN